MADYEGKPEDELFKPGEFVLGDLHPDVGTEGVLGGDIHRGPIEGYGSGRTEKQEIALDKAHAEYREEFGSLPRQGFFMSPDKEPATPNITDKLVE